MIGIIQHLLFLFVLLFLSGFFSGAETSLFSLNKIERRRIFEKHPFIGKTVSDLLDRPRRTLITILIGNMVVNTMATVMVTLVAIHVFGNTGAVTVSLAVFAFVLLLMGEVLPKIFAIRNNVLIAELSAVALNLFAKLLFPIRFVVRRISDWVLSFVVEGGPHSRSDLISENELKALVRIGEEEGVLRKEEVQMITRLINLGERAVKQIMTSSTDFVAFDIEEGPEALAQLIQKSHFSYIPVYEKSLDNLQGVISAQEFMLNREKEIRSFLQTPEYVPETKRIDELLTEFRLKGKRFAICVDEFGAVSGLVTFEDVIEEIFGEFHDEYNKVESLIKDLGGHAFLVDAKITLHDLNERLKIHLESKASETLNGWVLERLGRIPSYNESFFFEGIQFQIAEVLKRRIQKIYIRKRP